MSELRFQWLFNQRKLNLRPILEGPREFTTIQASELRDPSEFTTQGAIILTLGLAFENSPSDFSAYARTLAAAGVGAIGFGTGLTFATVPQELIDAAARHHLTLFEVPRATPFISIINTVTTEQTRIENNLQFTLHRQQERLNQAASNGTNALLERASKELGAAVAVANDSGIVINRHDLGELSAAEFAIAAASQSSGRTSGARSSINKDGTTIATITNVFNTHGRRRIALAVSREQKFDSYDRALTRHLAGLAEMLLQNRDSSARIILGALALATQVSGTTPALGATALDAAFNSVASHGRLHLCLAQADSPTRLSRALGLVHRATNKGGYACFVLPLEGTASESALIALPPETIDAQELFGRYSKNLQVSVLRDTPWEEISTDRVTALKAHARSLPPGTMAEFSSDAPAWLGESAVHEALGKRRAAIVGKLKHHDAAHNTELLRTLRTYLLADAQLAAAASELGVHRHTVRARIEKVQALCGIDLANPVIRAEALLLCLSS